MELLETPHFSEVQKAAGFLSWMCKVFRYITPFNASLWRCHWNTEKRSNSAQPINVPPSRCFVQPGKLNQYQTRTQDMVFNYSLSSRAALVGSHRRLPCWHGSYLVEQMRPLVSCSNPGDEACQEMKLVRQSGSCSPC